MSLRYILGDVGTGKTHLCIDEIIKKDTAFNNLIYIVPEQFSMESEKLLLKRKKEGTIINTGVYSFRHLAFNIMSELGVSNNNILNDVGRAMLLKKALINVEKDLILYKKSINQKGFNDSMGSTISELMQYNVSSENLLNAIDNLDESNLKYKLSDIEKIYTNYSNGLKDKYISAENTLEILSNIISESNMIKKSEIWIDGFKSFTPQEYNVITELLRYCKNVNISLTVNVHKLNYTDISPNDAYFETKTTIHKLNKIAEKNSIKLEKPVILKTDYRHNNNELKHLTKNYLNSLYSKYTDDCNNIVIYNTLNKYHEVDMVCTKIMELVKNKNYRYKDIAVILGSEDYNMPLSNMLSHYNIPNFIDTRKSITSHPLTRTITSIIKIVADNWNIDSVFNLLKTGYIPINENDVYLLENYVISQNIKGNKWFSEWEYGFNEKSFNENLIKDIKDIFIDYTSKFTSKIKKYRKYTVTKISEAVFDFLKDIDAVKTLNKSIENAEKENDLTKSMVDRQIWGLICDVFDKIVEFLGNEKITINEYIKILESGLDISTIGVIPALSDQLIVGDIERTRLPEIKALFILGMNEGIIPPQRAEAGIFSDLERLSLKNNYFDLAPDLTTRLLQDKFNIYIALTKPTDYLYLSYCTGSVKGDKLTPSPVINHIKNIFPKVQDKTYNLYENAIAAPLPAFSKLIDNISNENMSNYEKDIFNFFYNSEIYGNKIQNVLNMLNMTSSDYLSLNLTKNLYGDNINISVSKLESFAKCPYSFFLTYGLNAYERDTYRFEYLESGNIYHSALESAFNIINDNKMELSNLNDDELNDISNKAIDAAIIQTKKQSLVLVPRYKGYINRMKRTMYNVLWGFSNNAKKEIFKPKEFELSFGSKNGIDPIRYQLEKGKSLNLTGKIDRIDHFKDKDKIYVKIIDYKQSEHKIDFNKIYNGLDIQLPLYMNTYIDLMNKNQNINFDAGSILYYKVHNPQLSEDKGQPEKYISNDLRFRGIVSNEKIIASSIKSQVISPVMFSADNFKAMGKFIDKKIIELGNEISKGNISIKPYRYINGSAINTGCDNCKYKSICKIDLKDAKNKYNSYKTDKKIVNKIINNE